MSVSHGSEDGGGGGGILDAVSHGSSSDDGNVDSGLAVDAWYAVLTIDVECGHRHE